MRPQRGAASHVRAIAATTEERLRFRKVLFLVIGAAAVVGILVPIVLTLIVLLAAR
ncbi:MAG: hypothetical protein FJ096_04475 [Deltaproteobacteria bacterium]|nr:hypothetical protein [Deltaproteobacteria bacterium]